MTNYKDLVVWQKAIQLVTDIYKLTKTFPKEEAYGLASQMQRASISIPSNIAEGHDSGSDSKFIYYLNVSRGSCSEVNSMLYLCEDFKLCNSEKRMELQNEVRKISAGCLKMINTLKASRP